MEITPVLLKTLREDINSALKETSKKYKLEIKAGNCSYEPDTATFKLICSTHGALTREQKDLKQIAIHKDLDLDKIMDRKNGDKLKLYGYRNRAKKLPYILINLSNNKKYLFAASFVELYFSKSK